MDNIKDGLDLIAAIAVTLSVILIYLQVRTQTKLAKAQNLERLTDLSSRMHLATATEPALTKLWNDGGDETLYHGMTPEDRSRFIAMMQYWLDLYENLYG
ncbi:MAG: hypothetical protein AAF191_15655, partial [Verrucomicrobiota bacterium]